MTLNVRASNHSALTLYQENLGYELVKVDYQYYADKEDAFFMRKSLD